MSGILDKHKLSYEKTWPTRLKGTRLTRLSRSISGFGTGGVYDVFAPGMASYRRAVYKHPTFKAAAKKPRALMDSMYVLSVPVAILTLLATRLNIIFGKSSGWAKRLWTKLSWPATPTKKKTGSPKPSTGSKNSNKISMWNRLDNFFSYIALMVFSALVIRPEVIPDSLSRIVIVMLASYLIVRRF